MEKAFDEITKHAGSQERNINFVVTTSGMNHGVYIREPADLDKPKEIAVSIEPVFDEKTRTLNFFIIIQYAGFTLWLGHRSMTY